MIVPHLAEITLAKAPGGRSPENSQVVGLKSTDGFRLHGAGAIFKWIVTQLKLAQIGQVG